MLSRLLSSKKEYSPQNETYAELGHKFSALGELVLFLVTFVALAIPIRSSALK